MNKNEKILFKEYRTQIESVQNDNTKVRNLIINFQSSIGIKLNKICDGYMSKYPLYFSTEHKFTDEKLKNGNFDVENNKINNKVQEKLDNPDQNVIKENQENEDINAPTKIINEISKKEYIAILRNLLENDVGVIINNSESLLNCNKNKLILAQVYEEKVWDSNNNICNWKEEIEVLEESLKHKSSLYNGLLGQYNKVFNGDRSIGEKNIKYICDPSKNLIELCSEKESLESVISKLKITIKNKTDEKKIKEKTIIENKSKESINSVPDTGLNISK